ncbi:MAG: DMT family transporter [Arenicella sp.]
MNSRFAVIVLFLSSAAWGLTWLPAKALAAMGLYGMQLVLVTSFAVSVVLLPWMIKQREQWLPLWPVMLAIGFFGGFSNFAFQTSISQGDVIRVMILFYMLPIWSVLGGRIILKEVIDKKRILALFLCVLGAFFILEAWTLSLEFGWIDLLALGAGFSLAFSGIAFRFSADTPIASKIGFTYVGSILFACFFLSIVPSQGGFPNNAAIPLAAVYGIFWLMIITFGTLWAVTKLGVGRSASIIVMELVVAVLSVVIITKVDLKIHEFVGSVLAISAALIEGMRSDSNEAEIPTK